MSLIVEDGSIVAGAVSYVTLAEVRSYATARGLVFSSTDTDAEAYVRLAMDVVEAEEFVGDRVNGVQELSWPRSGVSLYGFAVAESTIPAILKNAVCQLAIDVQTQTPHTPSDGRVVISETLGPISTTYKDNGGVARPDFPAYRAAIRPLLKNVGLTVLRA
jgi:hypothetical protein